MDSVILNRQNAIYTARANQLRLNTLAADGGREYVDLRLWRGANESDLSWSGEKKNGIYIPGRKERTFNLNDAGRVAGKIEQYIFSEHANRDGADPDFLENVTGNRVGIDAFMLDVCHQITIGQWCWVQVDAPRRLNPEMPRTLFDKQQERYQVRWRLWPSLSVVDWHISEDGTIDWLITEAELWVDKDPRIAARRVTLRTLYELGDDGRVHVSEFKKEAGNVPGLDLVTDYVMAGLTRIPFALVGKPSAAPWWFDQVEAAQAQTMNLSSLNHETLFTSVFPQMVVSESMVSNLETSIREEPGSIFKKAVRIIREIIRGRRNPIVETVEEKGLTRFIEPTSTSNDVMSKEIERIRRAVFDNVGLALFNKETRQVQSAESKQFDHLDTNSTLRHRALMLQRAENDLVEISKMFDPNFKEWSPSYPSDFNVFDTEKATKALTMIANIPDATPEMKRMVLKAAVHMLMDIANYSDEQIQKVNKEVEEAVFPDRTVVWEPPPDDDEDEKDQEPEPDKEPLPPQKKNGK